MLSAIADRSVRTASRLGRRFGGDGDIEVVVRGAGLVLLIQVLGSALAYGTQVLLARFMGPFEFGVFVYAWSWASVLAIVALLGFSKSIVRFVPEYHTRASWGQLAGVIRRSRQIVFAGALGVAGLSCLVVRFALDGRIAPYYVDPFLIAMACVPFLALVTLYSETSRGFGWAGLAYSAPLLMRPGLFLLFLGVTAWWIWPVTSAQALAVAWIGCLATVGLQALFFRRRLPPQVSRAVPIYDSRYWLRISLPLFLVDGIVLLLWHVDILMLGAMETPDSVAHYNAAIRTAGLAFFFFKAVAALAAPRFAALYARGETRTLQTFAADVARWIFWPSLAVVLGVLLSGEWILAVFGPSFRGAYVALAILALGYLPSAATGPTSAYLIASGNHDSIVPVNLFVAVLNIALNAWMIPRWGVTGAAIASSVSLGIRSVWFYVLVQRRLHVRALFVPLR